MSGDEIFAPHLRDLCRAAENGRAAVSRFLTPEECEEAQTLIAREFPGLPFRFEGGWQDAERRIVMIGDEFLYRDVTGYICAVRADGGSYAALTHRAVLGTVLSLGIDRGAVGDIVLPDTHSAVVFSTPQAATLMLGPPPQLVRIGGDAVRVGLYEGEYGDLRRSYQSVTVIASSARLDCVASALCGVSRESVKEMIRRGEVSHNHRASLSADDRIEAGDIISVRAKGKYRIDSLDGRTRHDRIRISASRYM